MMKLLYLVLALLTFVCADDVNYSDCGSTIGNVNAVKISDCDTSMPRCILKRNTNATIELEFTPAQDGDNIETVIHGVLIDVPVPFPIPNPHVCVDSGLQCPIKSGQKYTYTTTLPVLKKYPRVTVDIKLELQMEQKDFVCVKIPAKLI